jgi:hypothetical protein
MFKSKIDQQMTKALLRNRGTTNKSKSENSRQAAMFDSAGCPPFSLKEDAKKISENPVIWEVSGMQFALTPTPRNPERALAMALDVLSTMHRHPTDWKKIWPERIEQPFRVDCWKCWSTKVSFNETRDDPVIYATYKRGDHLVIVMPHPFVFQSWRKAGLSWMLTYSYCCGRNTENPRPWAGKICGCK